MGRFGYHVIDADGHGGEAANWRDNVPTQWRQRLAEYRDRVAKHYAKLVLPGGGTKRPGDKFDLRPGMTNPDERLKDMDLEGIDVTVTFPGGAGVWISDPNLSTPLYSHDADEPIVTASLYKLAVMVEAERRVEAGQLHYGDIITIEDEDITEDGSFELAGTELTLDEALEAMITISDNGAALALWHVLGPENINATLVALGIKDFHVFLNFDEDNIATPRAVGTTLCPPIKRAINALAGFSKISRGLPA